MIRVVVLIHGTPDSTCTHRFIAGLPGIAAVLRGYAGQGELAGDLLKPSQVSRGAVRRVLWAEHAPVRGGPPAVVGSAVLRLRGGLEAERVLVFLVERDLALAVAGDMPARGCGLCRRDLLILHVVAGVL